MLVLARKKNEQLVITCGKERIVVTVISLIGDKVRLGVEADRRVIVHRSEIQAIVDAGEQHERDNR